MKKQLLIDKINSIRDFLNEIIQYIEDTYSSELDINQKKNFTSLKSQKQIFITNFKEEDYTESNKDKLLGLVSDAFNLYSDVRKNDDVNYLQELIEWGLDKSFTWKHNTIKIN